MVPLLSLNDVRIDRGGQPVVRGLCLDVAAGEVFGLLGSNGCGKSTTLSAVVGLLPSRGDIRIGGLRPSDGAAYRRLVGLVPQELALYEELTVGRNLDFFARLHGLDRRERRVRIAETLDFVRLSGHAGAVVRTLSGGMQRRLNLACSLLHRPRVLLLDEPTVGLDAESREAIFANLRDLASRGAALVFTTHHHNEAAALCGRLGAMDGGTLTELDAQRWRHHGPHAVRPLLARPAERSGVA